MAGLATATLSSAEKILNGAMLISKMSSS